MNQAPARPDYGIDAPRDLRRNALYGLSGAVMGGILLWLASGGPLGVFLGVVSLGSSILLLIICALMLWGSLVGKLRVRDQVIAALPWRGDEQVLDVGCGHGLMLIGAAKRLTTGKAIGIDLFLDTDQAANSPEATLRNAALEGVAQRVDVRRADARDLPYDNNTFDVVITSWVLHMMLEPDDRTRALREIMRVLKPGGRAVIVDTDFTKEYATYLESKHWEHITRSRPNYLFLTPTYTLTAVKPQV
jgi:SAM-dependent methyltransferase